MKMKLMALVLTVAIVGYSAFPAQASTSSHIHEYTVWSYVKTSQDGSYTHSYVTGINPITGTITYGTCQVVCETEYYTYRCNKAGCYASDGSLNPVPVESHGSCPK